MKRALTIMAAGILFACGVSGSPATYPFPSPEPLPEAYQCVRDIVAVSGFEIRRDRSDVGILEGVRHSIVTDTVADPAGGRRVRNLMEWQFLTIEVFEEAGDSSRVEYTVASGNNSNGPWGDPSRAIVGFAQETAERCS